MTLYSTSANNIIVEQIDVEHPDIDIYFYLEETVFEKIDVFAYLEEDQLYPKSVDLLDNQNEGTFYLFLVDISSSISQSQMSEIKRVLTEHAAQGGPKDKIALISFGETVNVLLNGMEAEESIALRIEGLKSDQRKALFFDALNRAIELSNIQIADMPKRKVVVIFSDAKSFEDGGISGDGALANLNKMNLPLYSIAINNGRREELNIFDAIARVSGGRISVVSTQTLYQSAMELLQKIRSPFVARLNMQNSMKDMNPQHLKISFVLDGALSLVEKDVFIQNRSNDATTVPVIRNISETARRQILVEYNKDVLNADIAENYIICDRNGQVLTVKNVVYNRTNYTAVLTLSDESVFGELFIDCTNIVENTMEKKPLQNQYGWTMQLREVQKKTFSTDPIRSDGETETGSQPIFANEFLFFAKYGWIIVVFFILISGVVVYNVVKKRKGLVVVDGKIFFSDSVERKYHFAAPAELSSTPGTVLLKLIITDAVGNTSNVELNINQRILIGRSDLCDIFFDDVNLSRQHFAIDYNEIEDVFYLQNLSFKNGTFVNSIPVEMKQRLNYKDVITAGKEKFIFMS